MVKHDVAQKACRNQAGFTLIELLIVIAIIAILAAIAIPQFLKYKQGAYLDSARSDVKNSVTAMEAYAAQAGSYPTGGGTCGPGPKTCYITSGGVITTAPTTGSYSAINVSTGNTVTISTPAACASGTANAGAIGYTVSGSNSQITSGPGSNGTGGTPVSYDSCTGAYTGF